MAALLSAWAPPSIAADAPLSSDDAGCSAIIGRLPHDFSTFGHGLITAPRRAVRPANLKWELPIAGATGLLIAYGDQPVNRRIQSPSFENNSTLGSNIGVGIELGAAGLMYADGCRGHRSPYMANTGWTALEAMGAANVIDLMIKAGTNRQYAYQRNSQGEFWEGGKSFASGHAATSFAFAAVIAHRYPEKRWVKWTAYGLATGVTLARIGGKKALSVRYGCGFNTWIRYRNLYGGPNRVAIAKPGFSPSFGKLEGGSDTEKWPRKKTKDGR